MPPTPAPRDIAQLLDTVPLTQPDDRSLLLSLAAAVNNARYWQEPDGEDVLAASPELRAPLARIAAALVDSPYAAWWSTTIDDSQWVVSFAGPPDSGPATVRSADEVLEHWHAQQLDEETAAERDRPTDARAPWSGSWWSKPPSALTRTTRSLRGQGPGGLWLVEDTFGWESATVEQIRVPRGARIFEIDGPSAWAELCRRYLLEVTASRRHDWYRTTGRIGRWVIPNWTQVQHDIDAVHLSVGGYLATAGHAIAVEDDLATVLAGWDPDQTYWLRDVTRIASTRQIWEYDQQNETWGLRSGHPLG